MSQFISPLVFINALAWVCHLTRGKMRKGDGTPYFGHLLRVAGLVYEGGGTERAAIIGLLHDILENYDHAATVIKVTLGEDILLLVQECSNTEVRPKPPWRERKVQHLHSLETAHPDVLRVMLADKLDNGRSLVDLYIHGSVFPFSAPLKEQVWHYQEFLCLVVRRQTEIPGTENQIDRLSTIVADLEDCLDEQTSDE